MNRVHIRTYTGKIPYTFPICGRRFTQKNDMPKQTNDHNKPPPNSHIIMKNIEIVISIDNKYPDYKNVSIKELREMCCASNTYGSLENGNKIEGSLMF